MTVKRRAKLSLRVRCVSTLG